MFSMRSKLILVFYSEGGEKTSPAPPPTPPPTTPPTPPPTPPPKAATPPPTPPPKAAVCVDLKVDGQDWHDSKGDEYTCKWSGHWKRNWYRCKEFGHKNEWGGYTAKQACCAW